MRATIATAARALRAGLRCKQRRHRATPSPYQIYLKIATWGGKKRVFCKKKRNNRERNIATNQINRTGGIQTEESAAIHLQPRQSARKADGFPQVLKAQPLGVWRQSQWQDGVRRSGDGVACARYSSLSQKPRRYQLLGGVLVATGSAGSRSTKDFALP